MGTVVRRQKSNSFKESADYQLGPRPPLRPVNWFHVGVCPEFLPVVQCLLPLA
jgi:hypothetical protein